jgi:hypothetical protein
MFAVNKNDPTFGMVYTSRVYRDELRSGDNLALIDAIAEYYLQDVCQIYGVVPPTLPYFDPAKNNLPKRLTIWLAWFMTWSQENQ